MQYLVWISVAAIILALSVEIVADNCSGDEHECTYQGVSCCKDNSTLEDHICTCLKNQSNYFLNISTNEMFSSIISLSGLYNITVSGHNNPTITCMNGGGLRFDSCHNCTIEGINWKGCGTNSSAVLTFYNSSNVTIRNCVFQQSLGQAIVLSEVSGDVNIRHCTFMNNSQHKGHGAAIHYTAASDTVYHTLTINNCDFTRNKGDVSIVYVKGSGNTSQNCCSLSDSVFLQNTGVPLYVSSQNLSIYYNVSFMKNKAKEGGGIYICSYSNVAFDQHSVVNFIHNEARSGGAIFVQGYSSVLFEANSSVTFDDNRANFTGGAVVSSGSSHVIFNENSIVMFINNKALQGGGIHSSDNSNITFKGNSFVSFENNQVKGFGGAIVLALSSNIVHKGNSAVEFINNTALRAGAVYSDSNSHVMFAGTSTAQFIGNEVVLNGGALYFNNTSSGTFKDNTTATFCKNKATINGGALYSNSSSSVTFEGNANVSFSDNEATLGAGICFDNYSYVLFSENSVVTFDGNIATVDGGAIHSLINSNVTFAPNSTIIFTNNRAHYGACLFRDTTEGTIQFTNSTDISFDNNFAKIAGNAVYIDVPKSCDSKCLKDRILGLNSNSDLFNKHIATPPTKLELRQPAQCLYNKSSEDCKCYYVKNIMLGEEIEVQSCILDYYGHVADTTQFLVSVDKQYKNYSIKGSTHVLISCDVFQGVSIVRRNNTDLLVPLNYTINITLDVDHNSDWKPISVNLTVELTPCHPGFHYRHDTGTCECYNSSSKTVLCSGSSSTISRGYWFGYVTERPTVTYCPIRYCNFDCCETSISGIYHLSPWRTNQCQLHRTGTACGSCTEGYTLPFDSTECVKTSSCTATHLALILTFTVIYWISIVVAVFALMYYKVGIGYLYVIIHYYSIMDIILLQKLHSSNNGLHTTVTIMSSIVKIIPQFLGQLCLVRNMSAIDQQFIHYIHPLAISLILVAISVLARSSKRVSLLISRGIIHVICFLLLLSYTSVATTSLLLMKPLTFENVDKPYTYLSPDIKYFSGRHLIYGIVAILCMIVIAIALPLLLLLEPFLNSKINFIKIKPLLDQFQGCYKDKYRYFAAFYMICRLIIILVTMIENLSDSSLLYILIAACVLMALIHLIIRPYSNAMLNVFDGLVLQLIILVVALSVVESFDSLVVVTAYILLFLPSILLALMLLMIYRENLKNIIKSKFRNNKDISSSPATDAEGPGYYFDTIIDENSRRYATVCDV